MIVITTIDALPDYCYECPCHDGESGYCQADKEQRYSEYRPYWCPLKEVNDDQERRQSGMTDRPKRKVEFIESYWTGGELGSDYQWSDNHGELIRCRDCKYAPSNGYPPEELPYLYPCKNLMRDQDWFCGYGKHK